jgi:hypothetical protein
MGQTFISGGCVLIVAGLLGWYDRWHGLIGLPLVLGGCPRMSVIGALPPGLTVDCAPRWITVCNITLSLDGQGGSSAPRHAEQDHRKHIRGAPHG